MTVKYFKQVAAGEVPDNQAICKCAFVGDDGNVNPPMKQAANVADATGADDVVTQLNALIASLKTAGIMAQS